MEVAGRPWQAIAVAVCVLGLAVSDGPPLAEGPFPWVRDEIGRNIFSQPEEMVIGSDRSHESIDLLLRQPALCCVETTEWVPIARYLNRLGQLNEPVPGPIDLTWPCLIVDPYLLTEGMPLSLEAPGRQPPEDVSLPEPVLVLVFGDDYETDSLHDAASSASYVANDTYVRVLNFLEMAISSDTTRVLYCDPGLMTEPNLFLVLSPIQSGSVTLRP